MNQANERKVMGYLPNDLSPFRQIILLGFHGFILRGADETAWID